MLSILGAWLMSVGNPNWVPGKSGNPTGRQPGTRNKRTEAIWTKLEDRGDLDPIEYLSSLVTNEKTPPEQRIAAATALAPYRHSKCGLTPQAPPLVYTTVPPLPHPACTDIRQAIENLEFLAGLRREGRLDMAAADAAISDMRLVRDGLIEEAKALIARRGPVDQHLVITGGLPDLPGTSILMPDIPRAGMPNGKEIDGQVVSAQLSPLPDPPSPKDDPAKP
jgi:hypothetical protein